MAVGSDSIKVSIKLRQVTETRTFSAGLRLVGTRRDLSYDFTTDRVVVTIGGSTADLDRLTGSALLVDLDVTGLGPGTVDVPVSIDLPTGPTLVSANPAHGQRHDHRDRHAAALDGPVAIGGRRLSRRWPACSAPTGSAVSPTST